MCCVVFFLWLFPLWGFKYLELEVFTLDLMEEKDNLFKCHSGSSFYFMGRLLHEEKGGLQNQESWYCFRGL